jgi:hypothetical protein
MLTWQNNSMQMRLLQTLLILFLLASTAKADYWVQKSNVGGLNRADATGFSLNGKGYMGTGYSGTYQSDWWEYDPASDTWTQKPPSQSAHSDTWYHHPVAMTCTAMIRLPTHGQR